MKKYWLAFLLMPCLGFAAYPVYEDELDEELVSQELAVDEENELAVDNDEMDEAGYRQELRRTPERSEQSASRKAQQRPRITHRTEQVEADAEDEQQEIKRSKAPRANKYLSAPKKQAMSPRANSSKSKQKAKPAPKRKQYLERRGPSNHPGHRPVVE